MSVKSSLKTEIPTNRAFKLFFAFATLFHANVFLGSTNFGALSWRYQFDFAAVFSRPLHVHHAISLTLTILACVVNAPHSNTNLFELSPTKVPSITGLVFDRAVHYKVQLQPLVAFSDPFHQHQSAGTLEILLYSCLRKLRPDDSKAMAGRCCRSGEPKAISLRRYPHLLRPKSLLR